MKKQYTISIHGRPYKAEAYAQTTGLTIEIDSHYGSSVTIFCGNGELAQDLANAINNVLHSNAALGALEAAE